MESIKKAVFMFCGAALLMSAGCGGKQGAPQQTRQSFSSAAVSKGAVNAGLADYRIRYYTVMEEAAESLNNPSGAGVAESGGPFTMTGCGPQGELPAEVKNPSLYAVFSQSAVPLAQLGKPMKEDAGLFAIEPALTGVYRWYGAKLLSFEPDAPLLPQQTYTVTLSNKIKSLGGKSLEGPASFTFTTEPLSVRRWYLGAEIENAWTGTQNVHPEDGRIINALFSHPVDLASIAPFIKVGPEGEEGGMEFTLSRPENRENGSRNADAEQAVRITLKKAPPLDTAMKVRLLKGAAPRRGASGTAEDITYSFHTLIPFQLYRAQTRSYASPRTLEGDSIPVILTFSYEVEKKNAEQYFAVSGLGPLNAHNVKVYGETVVLNELPLEYERDYQVLIKAGLKDSMGRALGKDAAVPVSVGSANAYVHIQDSQAKMLEASFPARYPWEARNPLALSRGIAPVPSPYMKGSEQSLSILDTAAMPKNKKRFFMEDLAPFLGPGGKGTVALRWQYKTASSWNKAVITRDEWLTLQVTDLGITTRYASNKALVWVTRLSTGEAVPQAQVELLEGATSGLDSWHLSPLRTVRSGATDGNGLAAFPFEEGEFASLFTPPAVYSDEAKGFRIRVREGGGAAAGGDEAEFIPNSSHNIWRFRIENTVSPFAAEKERPVVFLFTDRGLYRPGETVTFRGIDRNLKKGAYKPYTGPYTIEAQGEFTAEAIAALSGTATETGGCYGSFALPPSLDPGQYRIYYARKKGEIIESVPFTVANFERLRFEASLKVPDVTVYSGDKASAVFKASYLAGGALSGGSYSWYWTREPAFFSLGGDWEKWRFGPGAPDGRSYVARGEGTLGPGGDAVIAQETGGDGVQGAPYRYRLEASAQDAARQEVAAAAAVIAHPASFYIAARLDQGALKAEDAAKAAEDSAYFLKQRESGTLSWALVTPEGGVFTPKQEAGVSIQFIRHTWKQARQAGVGGRLNLIWQKVEELAEERAVKAGAKGGIGAVHFTPQESGQWEARISARDQKNRLAVTCIPFYVTGGGWVLWGSDDVDSIALTPDKSRYAPGETARLLARSPLPKGKYLLTLEREGIVSERVIELDGSARTIDIPIEESFVPIIYAALTSYTTRSGPPGNTYYTPDLDKPKGLFGIAPLYVDNQSRHYAVTIETDKGVYAPGGRPLATLKVTQNGNPVPGAEVSFMAVDRGVLDLINYHVPDPLAYFYNPEHFPLGVRGGDSRSLLVDPVTYALADLQGGGGDEGSQDSSKLEERKDFRPTAVFEPYLLTGSDGTVTVSFPLPDSLTTYRCTAVAVGADAFGIKEQDLKVSAPLVAAVAAPRKLRWRDTGTVSLMLTNLEHQTVEAQVSLAAEDGKSRWDTVLAVDGADSQSARIPPGETAEVRFRVAALGAGESRLVFTLRSPKVNERIIKTVEVDRPVVYETVSTIGSLGGLGNPLAITEEGLVIPSFVPEGTGSLSLTLSASRLAQLKEALGYLLSYPYGCLEQRTAALLPLLAFGGHLAAFDLDTPVQDTKKVIEEELKRLSSYKLYDGSYPYWPGGQYGSALVSLRMAHIARLARKKGYAVPAALNTAEILGYLESNMDQIKKDAFLHGYSLWVRSLYPPALGGGEITAFLEKPETLSIPALSFGGLAALEAGQRSLAEKAASQIRRFARPGARALDLTDAFGRQGAFWGYEADRYALSLMLFHALEPENDMTSRLITALIARQRRGIWGNTASSFWAVLAFGQIADAEQQGARDVTARASLGGAPLLERRLSGYGGAAEGKTFLFSQDPLQSAPKDSLIPLRIEREGEGPLYYTASLRYGLPSELASARDEGLGVYVETFDSQGERVSDGMLLAGKTYTRRVVLSSSRDRTFVALRAPVPSGAEIVDASFVTSAAPPLADDEGRGGDEEGRQWQWNLPLRFIMDDEIRFHWDFFPAGKQEASFRFRAVMPGVYPTPPAQAECMYEEEVFGRSTGELMIISLSGR
ncbi:MAG: alpha-2-macroglobulin [Spirochaetaceae bacterium]|nr:alpha-2-macroglobulin [Spirochaetaceae bacterium]